jgi:hypothetical protein
MATAELSYQVGTYHGTIEVQCDRDDDLDTVIALAKAKLRRISPPSYYPSGCGYESWREVYRRE